MEAAKPRDPGSITGIPSIVLAGGRARRLGSSKPFALVNDTPLLELALAAVDASRAVVVGPEDLGPIVAAYGAALTREDPPFGGPVAAIAAGIGLVPADAEWVIVLACDIPRAAELLPALVRAAQDANSARVGGITTGAEVVPGQGGGVDAVVVVNDGQAQRLVGIYRTAALRRALDVLRDGRGITGAAIRDLVAPLLVASITDESDASHDIDTVEDISIVENALRRRR